MSDIYLKKPWSTYQDIMANTQANVIRPTAPVNLYLYNVNSREQLHIKLIPDQLSETYSQNIISVEPFGVIHPIQFYGGGSNKSLAFEFILNEDMAISMGLGNTIYEVSDKIKRLSEPVVKSGKVYREPLVYFELGNQFAGIGHITTSLGYRKPYSRGRYTVLSCSISFVFHELFKQEVGRLGPEPSTEVISSQYSFDFEGSVASGTYDNVEDFYKENFDTSYFFTEYIFGDMKVKTLFASVFDLDAKNKSFDLGASDFSDLMSMMFSEDQNVALSTYQNISALMSDSLFGPQNPLVHIVFFYYSLGSIINTLGYYSKPIQALETLLANVNVYEATLSPEDLAIGFKGFTYKDYIEHLKGLINKQISAYKILRGVTA